MSNNGYEFVDFDYSSQRRKLQEDQISVNYGGGGKTKNYSVTLNVFVSNLIDDKYKLCRVKANPETNDVILRFDNNKEMQGFKVSHCGNKRTCHNVCVSSKPLAEFFFRKFGFDASVNNRIVLNCHVDSNVHGEYVELRVNKL